MYLYGAFFGSFNSSMRRNGPSPSTISRNGACRILNSCFRMYCSRSSFCRSLAKESVLFYQYRSEKVVSKLGQAQVLDLWTQWPHLWPEFESRLDLKISYLYVNDSMITCSDTSGSLIPKMHKQCHLRCVIMWRYESIDVSLLPGTSLIDHSGIFDHIARLLLGRLAPFNKATLRLSIVLFLAPEGFRNTDTKIWHKNTKKNICI